MDQLILPTVPQGNQAGDLIFTDLTRRLDQLPRNIERNITDPPPRPEQQPPQGTAGTEEVPSNVTARQQHPPPEEQQAAHDSS